MKAELISHCLIIGRDQPARDRRGSIFIVINKTVNNINIMIKNINYILTKNKYINIIKVHIK